MGFVLNESDLPTTPDKMNYPIVYSKKMKYHSICTYNCYVGFM